MKMSMGLAAAIAAIGLAACGGSDDGGGDVTANTASASASVMNVGSVVTSIGSSDGGAAAGGVYSLGGSASSIVQPMAQTAGRLIPPSRGVTGQCDCDANGCTFVECGDESGTWTVDGTVEISGSAYTFDLDMGYNTAGYEWDWSYGGTVDSTATDLDGSLDGEGSGTFDNGQGTTIEVDWEWSVDWNTIGLTSGCATSGTLDASSSYSADTGQGSGSYSGSVSVTFGPNCGDAI